MDAFTEEGVVLLGGPIGEGDDDDARLVFDLEARLEFDEINCPKH